MRILILVILNSLIISFVFAQEKKFIRQGNNAYETKDYENSELKYRKALEKNTTSFDAGFNLGDALFRQEKYDEAATQFRNIAQMETSKENKAKAYHNLGNTYMLSKDEQQQPKLEQAIEAYKDALRNNPKDDETRYNLAYAQKMLQQQQQKQDQNKDQNKDKDKDQNKDQQDDKQDQKKQKDKEQKDQDKEKQNKNEENKPQDQKDQQKKEQKQQQIPKEKAEQMLKALENDEKDLQKKMKMQKVKGQKVKVEKDW